MSTATGADRSLNQRRIQASRLEAARAALVIVERDGWDALEVAGLAAAAGMSTRTFYRYFPGKRDVFRPLLEEAGLRSRAVFAQSAAEEFPQVCAESVMTGVQAFPGGLAGAQRAYRILLTTPELTPVWLDEALSYERELAPLLPPGLMPAGSAWRSPHVDGRRLLAALVFAAMRVALQEWVDAADPATLHDMAVQTVSIALGRPF
jgi:AcrR family transcriptional regulator